MSPQPQHSISANLSNGTTDPSQAPLLGPPNEPLHRLFGRFLRFGMLAWGGPVAQIAMIRQALVDEERWISSQRFNRVLAVYQALPGPEAHELCVYFGMLARGRLGAVLAGLGFMLPGLVLMLALSWAYVRFGIRSPLWNAAFAGCQAGVAALIVRATHRLGIHALHARGLVLIAVATAASQWLGLNPIAALALAGLSWALARGRLRPRVPNVAPGLLLQSLPALPAAPGLVELFLTGLRTGLLTFGGAYTAIPFLQSDAVARGGWLTQSQFLDGLALSSILPAPFIIFSTFVGYLGGGFAGALLLTTGVFLPAFAFTLIGHDHLERVVEMTSTHAFLDGVTAGVVGIIAVTAVSVTVGTVSSVLAAIVFVGALLGLYTAKSRLATLWVMVGAAVAGLAFGRGLV
jgi:chromate transporter